MAEKPVKESDPTEPLRRNRPLSLRIMFWMFVLWSLLGWLRFARTLADYSLIMDILPRGLVWYLVIVGLLYGIVGVPALWGLARGARWTLGPLVVAAIFYPALYWIERLLLWRDPAAHRNWPFMLLLTVLWFGLVLVSLRAQGVRRFFKNERNEY